MHSASLSSVPRDGAWPFALFYLDFGALHRFICKMSPWAPWRVLMLGGTGWREEHHTVGKHLNYQYLWG